MVSGILHETGRISSRFAAVVTLLLCTITVPVSASPLFEDDSVLEIRLKGPLGTISRDRKDDDRVEHPFALSVDGRDIAVDVRVRGKSRTIVCRFPPLRLNFSGDAISDTVFAGQDKLKLVTHCRNDKDKLENNLLEEYAAYRIFNLISDTGYRVRLLRIHYEDTDGKQKNLDRPYYGFLIESDEELAARSGGTVAEIGGVPYSRLDEEQTARLYVFQYLIGNFDWSFVIADEADACCHNIDLLEKGNRLYPIPYDFDFSGLVNASYVKVPEEIGTRRATQRVYRGYCKIAIESVVKALDEIVALRDEIMSVVENSPVVGDEHTASRVRYIGYFFEQALDEREDMIEEFQGGCLGPH